MTILWDWNGTLVADVPHVVAMNNQVLEQFGYRHTSEEEYRAKFRHPVHEYYYDLGVTAEDFPKIAKVWNKAYVDGFDCVPLAPGVADAVRRFHDAGFRQAIISASQVDQLRAQVEHFPDVIYGAFSPEEFTYLCAQALDEDRRWVCQRRKGYGQSAAWTNRAAEVSRILSTAGLL